MNSSVNSSENSSASILLSAFSPAKINLFLHITGRRADGYHLLQSIFCPISLGDELELTLEPGTSSALDIQRTGDLTHLPESADLTVRACKAFYANAKVNAPCKVTIHTNKHTPEQAGLGGGSSNAATVLRLLQKHHGYPINPQKLAEIALTLGADVPFFLQDSSAFVEGIGELISPIPGISGHLVIYKPPISCATGEIFSDPQLTRNSSDVKIAVFDSARRVNGGLMDCLQTKTHNALQPVVSRKVPEWNKLFEVFTRCVQEYNPLLVRMSGSGSAMFAVFASPNQRSNSVAAVASAPELKNGRWFECQVLGTEQTQHISLDRKKF